jgi:hypothetical protein
MGHQDMLASCLDAANVSILSVGSGDGSQQQAIVKQGHAKVLTTFYDSKDLTLRKYPHAGNILRVLEESSYKPPLYGIDATKLHTYSIGTFDLIIFTFPHTGVPNSDRTNVASNQSLLRGFLRSAERILTPSGQIQITLKVGEHYDKWNVASMMEDKKSLKYKGSHDLQKELFPGYVHRLTKGTIGSLKRVVDKKGAQVHIFDKVLTIGATNTPVGSQTVIVAPPVDTPFTDEEMYAEIVSILHQEQIPRNVLEIRRHFDDPKPDTRQFNRIIYAMKANDVLEHHSPNRTNQKPCWKYKNLKGT